MRRVLTLAAALALYAGAYGDIETYVDGYYQADVPPGSDPTVPDFNDGTYYTIDLRVIVSNDDDWTSSAADATIDSGQFFCHPLKGGGTPPLYAFVALYPATEFDCFYCATEADPFNQPPYKDPSFAGDVIDKPQYRSATWFDIPPNGLVGDFLNARYTIHAQDAELPVTFHVQGAHTTYNGGGHLYPFEFTCVIPEPASLAALGLGIALIRRR